MKISIITATYNSEETIAECMQSVLGQSYLNIEYVIIDGASSDNTLSIVEKAHADFPNRDVLIFSEADQGIYDALNKGISKASGEIIGFLHSDDLLHTATTISTIANLFKEKKVHGVYSDLIYVNAKDTSRTIRHWKSETFYPILLKKGWMPAHPTLYLKKDVYDAYGVFDLTYKIAADYDFVLRIFKDPSLSFAYLQQTSVKMRMGGASNRSFKNIIKKSKEDYRALKSNQVGGWNTLVMKNVSKLKQFLS